MLFAFVRNQGSAWSQALNYLTRYLDEALLMAPHEPRPAEPPTPEALAHPLYLDLAGQLGQRTAEMHRALCPDGAVDDAFAPEPITAEDLAQWRDARHRRQPRDIRQSGSGAATRCRPRHERPADACCHGASGAWST